MALTRLRKKQRRCIEEEDAAAAAAATTTTTTPPAVTAAQEEEEIAEEEDPDEHNKSSSFSDLSSELCCEVAGYCDRQSQAYMELTSKRLLDSVRRTTTIRHFPLSAKFLTTRSSSHQYRRLRLVILSKDGRRLVVYKSKKDRFNVGCLEVWDPALGCLASLEGAGFAAKTKPVKPSISPCGRYVACGNLTYGTGIGRNIIDDSSKDGILLILLPDPAEQEPIRPPVTTPVTFRVLENFQVTSIQFILNKDNNTLTTIVFSRLGYDGFWCCNIVNEVQQQQNNRINPIVNITVSDPIPYITYPVHRRHPLPDAAAALSETEPNPDDPGHPLQLLLPRGPGGGVEEFSTVGFGRMAVFNNIQAFVYSSYDRYIVLRDMARLDDNDPDAIITRQVPKDTVEVFDMCFTPDGKRLLLSHFQQGLSVLDTDVERIEDIGEIEVLRLSDSSDSDSSTNNKNKGSGGGSCSSATRTSGDNSGGGGGKGRSQYGYFSFSPDSKRAVTLNMAPAGRQLPHVIDLEKRRLLSRNLDDDDLSWSRFLVGDPPYLSTETTMTTPATASATIAGCSLGSKSSTC